MSRRGLMLVNTGTPKAPTEAEVRCYLREFLSDPHVLDINPILRWLLLNLVILRRRPRVSAAAYRSIWTADGSPLLVHGRSLVQKLRKRLGSDFAVHLAMRYGEPSIADALNRFRDEGVADVMVLPLFPQGASATTGSVEDKVRSLSNSGPEAVRTRFVGPFFDHPLFISAFSERASTVLRDFEPDMVLMSFRP